METKKIWILERFYSREEDKKTLLQFEEMRDKFIGSNDEEMIEVFNRTIDNFNDILLKYPDGHWVGFEGKIKYKEFCSCAKAAIRRNPGVTFRVVKAEVPADSKYWNNYTNIEVNEGVLRYLMATL